MCVCCVCVSGVCVCLLCVCVSAVCLCVCCVCVCCVCCVCLLVRVCACPRVCLSACLSVNQNSLEEFSDESEPWLWIRSPSKDLFLRIQSTEQHLARTDLNVKD